MKRLVYQTHTGRQDHAFYSFESVQRYCGRYGIKYICDIDAQPYLFEDHHTDKFRCLKYLKDFDQVLYVDSDIIVHPQAPNIFDEYKDECFVGARFTMCDQLLYQDSAAEYGPFNGGLIMFNNIRWPWDSVRLYNIRNDYAMSGVARTSKMNEKLGSSYWWEDWEIKFAEDVERHHKGHVDDERLLFRILDYYGIKTFHIDRKWNHVLHRPQAMHDTWFWHFAGSYKRDMRQYYERLFMGRKVSA